MSNQLPTPQPPSPPSSHTHSRGSSLTLRVGSFKTYSNSSLRLANDKKIQSARITQYAVALPQRERSKRRISRLFTVGRTSVTFTPPLLPFDGRKFALCAFGEQLK